jgi:hypothetical protein
LEVVLRPGEELPRGAVVLHDHDEGFGLCREEFLALKVKDLVEVDRCPGGERIQRLPVGMWI